MGVTLEQLRQRKRDYLEARWEDGQLVMSPFCYCGEELDEKYACPRCQHQCDCTFVACRDPQALAEMQRLVQGNPSFAKFEVAAVDG